MIFRIESKPVWLKISVTASIGNYSPFPDTIGGGGVYVAPAGFFLAENLIFQKKNAYLADFATGFSQKIKQNL